MSGRRTITAAMAKRILLIQVIEGITGVGSNTRGRCIACPICGCMLGAGMRTVWEHMTPLALGGADDETNIRLVHRECALKKTNGPRHVKVDGDASKIAKAKRLAGERKPKHKRTWPSRALSSRPFQKRKEIRT